ncbi:reverse transcriptase [Tanacetum coccineum]
MSVRMFKPTTLADAYSLTRLQEAILDDVKKKNRPSGSFNSNMFGNGGNYGNVSKHAILPKPNTPVNTPHLVHILVDCGSTHNFLDKNMAKKLGCSIRPTGPLAVIVVDGNNLVTTSESTLGDIKCNSKDLRMEFNYEGKKVKLKGTHKSNVVWMSDKKSEKNARHVVQGEFHSMALSVYPMDAISCSNVEGMPMTVNEKIQTVLQNYKDVFGIPAELPPQRSHDHRIPLVKGALPVNIRPYRHPPTQKDAIETMVRELLEAGVIKMSHSPFASPIVMVKKKDNSWRMCVDYQAGFKCLEEHVKHLQTILESMRTHKLFAKLSKCVSGTTQVEYLGYVISAQGVATDPAKIEAMANWPVPTSLKQLRRAYEWNNAAQVAFKALKEAMISASVLKLPDFTKELTVKTDALGGGIGAVLLQEGFDFAIVYKGVDNVTVDALSRMQNPAELLSIIGTTSTSSNEQGHYTWHNQQLRIKGKLMVGNDEVLRTKLLQQVHGGASGGHSGVKSNGQTEVVNRCLECYLRFHIPYIGGESRVDLVDKTLREREAAVEVLKFHISRAQSRMKSHDDKGTTDKQFDCGDWVFLKLQLHRQVSLRQGYPRNELTRIVRGEGDGSIKNWTSSGVYLVNKVKVMLSRDGGFGYVSQLMMKKYPLVDGLNPLKNCFGGMMLIFSLLEALEMEALVDAMDVDNG